MDLTVPQTRFIKTDEPKLSACFELRYQYFVRERGWVAENAREPGFERDAYDQSAWHLACFDGKGVCAYLRALPGRETPFMLDREFAPLLTDELRQSLNRNETLELSRLVVRPESKTARHGMSPHPVEHLLKALYRRAAEEDYSRFCIVVEEKWPRLFSRRFGLAFRVIGNPHVFSDGTRTVVAEATLKELEENMRGHSDAKYEWYRSAAS